MHKSLMVSGLHFTLEAVAEAEEEVVGGFRVADLETDVEEEALSDEGLEGGDIVEAAELGTLVDDIVADTDIHRENRSLKLCAEGEAGS